MSAEKNDLGPTPNRTLDCGALGALEMPGEWVDFLTRYTDIFRRDHCGYWMYCYAPDPERPDGPQRWLAYEHEDERVSHLLVERVLEAFREGEDLPSRWFVIDEAFAERAWLEGVKLWGVGWYDGPGVDATRYDVAVQMARFGEVKYG